MFHTQNRHRATAHSSQAARCQLHVFCFLRICCINSGYWDYQLKEQSDTYEWMALLYNVACITQGALSKLYCSIYEYINFFIFLSFLLIEPRCAFSWYNVFLMHWLMISGKAILGCFSLCLYFIYCCKAIGLYVAKPFDPSAEFMAQRLILKCCLSPYIDMSLYSLLSASEKNGEHFELVKIRGKVPKMYTKKSNQFRGELLFPWARGLYANPDNFLPARSAKRTTFISTREGRNLMTQTHTLYSRTLDYFSLKKIPLHSCKTKQADILRWCKH